MHRKGETDDNEDDEPTMAMTKMITAVTQCNSNHYDPLCKANCSFLLKKYNHVNADNCYYWRVVTVLSIVQF